jgi:hypothetical protein
MKVDVSIDATATTSGEISKVDLVADGRTAALDIDMEPFFSRTATVPQECMDFLFTASIVYGIDKFIGRARFFDQWTRDISVIIPVSDASRWNSVADLASECVSFLTGDEWVISFSEATRPIDQRRERKRWKEDPLTGDSVSLFSGGLDSLIGAIDFLAEDQTKRLLLVGHHDGAVGGPMADQGRLYKRLCTNYTGRIDILQPRVGIKPSGEEISFRSRSLVFLALGIYAAELLGEKVPVYIPENGPIALNPPLTPSRRGSCSTRTAHPHFLEMLGKICSGVGIHHPVENRYRFKTKGEMVAGCGNPILLEQAYRDSVSCAKSGHTVWWRNKNATSCGRCVPCLFRRASLHPSKLDNENFGFDVLAAAMANAERGDDFRSLISFLRRDATDEEIADLLISNGPVPFSDVSDYILLIQRMKKEVRKWIEEKSESGVLEKVGLR